jgi:hypothetical protein
MSGILLAASGPFERVELDATYSAIDLDLTSASASIVFGSDGTIKNHNSNPIGNGQWIVPDSAAPGLYEIRATPNPDTPDAGTMNTWLALTLSRTWTENHVGGPPGDEVATFDIEIRRNGGAVIASTTVTLTARIVI